MKVINMRVGSLIMMIISVFMVMQLGGVKGFKSFNVGGAINWSVPQGKNSSFFDTWASSKRFHVGDSLQFQYKNDSVLVVDKYGYYHCDNTKAKASYNDGNTFIRLDQPGLIYFISGTDEHCRSGQRLVVDVMSPHSLPPALAPAGSHSHQANSPTTAPSPVEAHNSGAPMAQVSVLLGIVATSVFFV